MYSGIETAVQVYTNCSVLFSLAGPGVGGRGLAGVQNVGVVVGGEGGVFRGIARRQKQ